MAKKRTTTKRSLSAKAKPPTAMIIRELNELTERRLELQRERDVLKRREDAIKKQLMDHVDAKGGRKKEVKLGGYVVALVPGKVYVKWKDEFIRVAGTDEAERVTAGTTPKPKLEIKVA